MTLPPLKFLRLVAGAAALPALSYFAWAQAYPTRPVTMVVTFAPGGANDTVARILSSQMGEALGQSLIVENVTGASGTTGTLHVAKSTPDGYQFVLGDNGTFAINQTAQKRPLYNALTDFEPVGLIAELPLLLATRKDLPVDNLGEFIAYAKANQTRMQYGSAGVGTGPHLACVMLNSAIGVDVTHITYRGGGPAMQDLIAGRIDYLCPIITPAPIVKRLHDAFVAAIESPSVEARMREVGTGVVSRERRSPEYLQKFVESEIEKWAGPIKASGVSMD